VNDGRALRLDFLEFIYKKNSIVCKRDSIAQLGGMFDFCDRVESSLPKFSVLTDLVSP